MTIEMNPALARGAAQIDFSRGCLLDDNPYPVGSDTYLEWEGEMRRLLDEEDRNEFQDNFYEDSDDFEFADYQ
jgi:hypothetical protein